MGERILSNMLGYVGFFLLLLACLLSLYGFISAIFSGLSNQKKFLNSAKSASYSVVILSFSAAILLWWMLFSQDYSLEYVHRNSSLDLPIRYKISAFWSALEGSHFLWALLLTFYSAVSHRFYHKANEVFLPYVSATLHLLNTWMFYLACTCSDPFKISFPIPTNGSGLNALLQNPYMIIHPPCLFTGYTSLAVSFAYSVAALFLGKMTPDWLITVRRWTLFSFIFLTIGIFLGGRWAYVELGWAGYWAWDPVENSSFIPWLFTTALVHNLLIQKSTNQMKRITLLLSFFAFYFSFFGTFITRSGMVSSVHSFAESDIGPNYLLFLSTLFALMLTLYAWKAPKIASPQETSFNWGISRESMLIVTIFLLTFFASIVLLGTLYPIFSELITQTRLNIQAPYFNTFAPYIGFCLIIGIGLGNLMRSGRQSFLIGGKQFQYITMITSTILTYAFSLQAQIFASKGATRYIQFIGVFLCFWCFSCLVLDFYSRLKDIGFQMKLFFKKNLSYSGSFLAHIGILAAILGFLGNYRGLETTVTLQQGETIHFYEIDFLFQGIQITKEENVTLYKAPLLFKDGILTPARAQYPTSPEVFHEVGIYSTFWYDIYAVLSDFQPLNTHQATLSLHINPTVRLVWWSGFLMVLGAFLGIIGKRRKKEEALP
jgi:cytochrome c-type biogenesis protein CcmF